MAGGVRFPVGMTEVEKLELLDKVMIGVNADGSAQTAAINKIVTLVSAAASSGIEAPPAPGSVLPDLGVGNKITFLNEGTYTQPISGAPLVIPADKLTVGFWDGAVWSAPIQMDLPPAENKINNWVEQAYQAGDQKLHNDRWWEAVVNTTAAQEPGVVARTVWKPILERSIDRTIGNSYTFSGFISYEFGTLMPNANYISTDFIPLVKDSDIYVYGFAGPSSCFIAFYTKEKNYISGINGGDPAINKEIIVLKSDIPENAAFVRGNAYITTPNPRISALSLTSLLSYLKDLPQTSLTKNLFNKYSIIEGQFVQNPPLTGLGNGINYSTSDFIPVNPSTEYSVSGYGSKHYQINIARYTSSKTNITTNVNITAAGYKFTTPSDCYFIKITVRTGDPADNTDINKIQIEQGNLVTDYENFGIRFINNIPISRESILPPLKPTSGKTWLIIGDSITLAPNSWAKYINQLTDASTIWNRAVSGASFKYSASHTVTQIGDDGETYYVQNSDEQIQCALVDTDIVNPDIVVVSLGTNDGITALGDYASAMGKATLVDLNKSLLYEAIRWAFWTLQMEYPGAMFYAVTPIQRASAETEALDPLYTAIKKMAARYNFIIIDATAESGIVKDFEINGANGRYLHDGLHPYNIAPFMGDKLIARCICSKVLSTYIDVSLLV